MIDELLLERWLDDNKRIIHISPPKCHRLWEGCQCLSFEAFTEEIRHYGTDSGNPWALLESACRRHLWTDRHYVAVRQHLNKSGISSTERSVRSFRLVLLDKHSLIMVIRSSMGTFGNRAVISMDTISSPSSNTTSLSGFCLAPVTLWRNTTHMWMVRFWWFLCRHSEKKLKNPWCYDRWTDEKG